MSALLRIMPLPGHDGALALPGYETPGAAGMDLRACLPVDMRDSGYAIPPGVTAQIGTGLAIALPQGHEGQVRPRSGLAARHGLTVLNAPGTIDEDYRGEVGVLLINLGPDTVVIAHGDRIAQLVIAPVTHVATVVTETLDETDRRAGGFGSTGRD